MNRARHIAAQPYFNALVLPLSYVALSLTPNLPSVSLLLAVLIFQTTDILDRGFSELVPLTFKLSIGSTLAKLYAWPMLMSAPTFSPPTTRESFIFSLFTETLCSALALIPLWVRHLVRRHGRAALAPWFRITLFPTVWALNWVTAGGSPSGRLGSWTPLVGDEAYRWTRPFVGFVAIDFAAAGWAEVIAGLARLWILGSPDEEVEEVHPPHGQQAPLVDHEGEGYGSVQPAQQQQQQRKPRSNSLLILAAILFLLGVPSYQISPLPIPTYSESTTPLSVACVLPPHRSLNSSNTPLREYIAETTAVAPRAKIVLWPEGAVSFRTSAERKEAIELLKNITVGNKVWIGMSFEDSANNEGDEGEGKPADSEPVRNGMALISPDPNNPVVFEYSKKNKIPNAEAFPKNPSTNNPPIATIQLPAPPSLPASEQKSYPRPISLSASICLDFTQQIPHLPYHPDLILAPARTPHPSLGLAMASLAAARGDELGASVLWCDGGSGAVNGVYGYGRGSRGLLVEEVGNGGGSWVATFGVPYNGRKDEGRPRTVYAWAIDGVCPIFFLLAILVGGWKVEGIFERWNNEGPGWGDHGFTNGVGGSV
ncbi:hypothetical protein FRC00_009916 [Tulasnella sp. 408]|nr:hypothetical protein FRC00_009916 [Tulasnella sp. 408]